MSIGTHFNPKMDRMYDLEVSQTLSSFLVSDQIIKKKI